MKILILNGPNLNLLGKRQPEVYGEQSFEPFFEQMQALFSDHQLDYFQDNKEGVLVDQLQEADKKYDAIILNAGGYTHTSVAIADAIAAIDTPVIEVHISNPKARESYRHRSLLTGKCKGIIAGFGLASYHLALDYLINRNS